MAWAYAHPVRARALMILAARVASPREIAEELGEPLGKVSYHVRELRDAGLIELVETDGSSGGVQHFYRATRLPIVDTETAVSQDPRTRAVASAVVINLMVSDVAAAVEAGTLDSLPERVLVRYHARVDARAGANSATSTRMPCTARSRSTKSHASGFASRAPRAWPPACTRWSSRCRARTRSLSIPR